MTIQIKNKRRFTLRQIRLVITASDISLPPIEVSDLPAKGIRDIELMFPKEVSGPAVTLEGNIEFVSHYGFKSNVPVLLIVD